MVAAICGLACYGLQPVHLLSPDDLVLRSQGANESTPFAMLPSEGSPAPRPPPGDGLRITGLALTIAGGSTAAVAGAVFVFSGYDSLFTDNDPQQRALDDRRMKVSRIFVLGGAVVAAVGVLLFLNN